SAHSPTPHSFPTRRSSDLSVGSFFNQLLFAIKFRDPNIVISNYLTKDSQILYDRDPQHRVREVAPFLSLDSQMYPAIVDGEMVRSEEHTSELQSRENLVCR